MYEEVVKDKNSTSEKLNSTHQQCELFKVENTELIDKNNQKTEENKTLSKQIEHMSKERNDLMIKLNEMDKLRTTLNEKTEFLTKKEHEIYKLKASYSDLEEFIENLKAEKEHSIDLYKKQVSELANEIENLKEIVRLHEEKLQIEPLNDKKIEELEKNITDLEIENKHLKEQKDKMKKYSEEILLKVKNDLKETEFLIDKRMISNILIKYFDRSANEKLKQALLDTLANFMGYTNEERKKIGLSYTSNLIPLQQNNTNKDDKLKELSDELYNFILNA